MNTIEEELTQHTERVFKTTYQNTSCYVKRRIATKRNVYHRFLHVLYYLTRIPFFAVTVADIHQNVCTYEAKKIMRLYQAGIHVPRVLCQTDDYLVIEDCGPSLSKIISLEPENTQYYLKMAIETLAKLHQTGECHGGSQIRNFTYKDGKVYLIDFEEIIDKNDFEGMILRDIILFLMSLTSNHISEYSIFDLISDYEKTSGISIQKRLLNFAGHLKFIELFTKKPFVKWVGKDVLIMNQLVGNLQHQLSLH